MIKKKIIIPSELEIDHSCEGCSHYDSEKFETREPTLREHLFHRHDKKLLWTRKYDETCRDGHFVIVTSSTPNWCNKFRKQVNPDDVLACFEWYDSHEFWYPDIHVFVGEDGNLEVKFE